MVRHNPHHFVNIWEGRPFVHAWLGRVQHDRCVNSNKQSDHSPGGGAISPHVWMIPCILHLWALFLYVATTLSLVVVDGTSPTSLLWEVPSVLFSFCLPMLYFYFVSVEATSELSPSPAKRKNNSLFVHPRNCICPLCTWKFKYTESSVTNWRGNVECTTYVFTPRPETPYQKDSLMVVMDWTLQTLEVIPMLLILAGDVETNPGPLELTVANLSEKLANVNDPIQLGTCLKIKMAVMDKIRRQYQDIDAQKREVFWYIENNQKRLGITWSKIADVLDKHLYMGDLADEIRSLTMENDAPLTEPFAGAATLPQEEMPTQRPQLGLQGDTVTMETGVEDAATDETAPLTVPSAGAAMLPEEGNPTLELQAQLRLEGDTITMETAVEEAATDENSSVPSTGAAMLPAGEGKSIIEQRPQVGPEGDTVTIETAVEEAATGESDHLLLACKNSNEELVHYLLTEVNCSPNVVNSDKQTPLVITKNKKIIRLLLQHGAVAKNAYDQHRKTLGKVFSKKALKNPVRMFIIGCGGEGKSTLVEALQHEPSLLTPLAGFFGPPKEVSGVSQKTAGIEPIIFKSKIFGDILCYDFAGQDAYYSSHTVIMKRTVDTCPPIFTLVIGLHNDDNSITHSVYYWLGMIENQCKAIEGKAPLIVVGSHLDLLQEKDEVDRKKQIVIQAVYKYPKFELVNVVTMDCRYSNSEGMNLLRHSIGTCGDSIRSRLAVSLNAHMFFIYLVDNYQDAIAVTLEEVRSKLEKDAREDRSKQEQDREVLPFIPTTLPHLLEICVQLNDKGHILFLQNTTSPEKSFVVTNKTALMREINGSIFAPKSFKEHCQLASSTGVVPESKIALAFPKYDVKMLVGFFTHFELGVLIEDKEALALIAQRLAETGELAVPFDEMFMFCPGLICLEAPERVWEFQDEINYHVHFGWILSCSRSNQFLNVRFFQVLLLRLALSLRLAISIDESIPSLQHFCSVWKRGICWCNDDEVTTLIELDRHYKSITVQMRSRTLTPKFMQLCSRVINKIRDAAKEFCSSVSTVESLIDPTEVVNYPMKPSSELTLFHVNYVAETVVNCKTDVKSQFKTLSMDRVLQVEVYAGLGEQILQPLFNENSPEYDKAISDRYLSALTSRLEEDPLQAKIVHYAVSKGNAGCVGDLTDILKSCTYRSLRRCLDAFSVFAGRNLLELAGDPPKPFSEESFPILETTINQAKVMYSPDLSTHHLKSLRTVLWEIQAQWYDLAIELKVTEKTRETIKEDHRDVSKRFTALLEEWLKDNPKLDDLIKALKSPCIGRADLATELETKVKSGELVLW